MTDKQRIAFIKNKLAPLFDGMNAKDAYEILHGTLDLIDAVFLRLTLSLNQKSDR